MKGSWKVVIIDYELGNLFSVKQACEHFGAETVISSDGGELTDADFAILPGVGAFGDAMTNLRRGDLVGPIKDYIAAGKPFMGVCLGLQLLFAESEEFGAGKGLGVIEGSVRKIPRGAGSNGNAPVKVPQIQWNRIGKPEGRGWDGTPLETCEEGDFMYFVHSFYATPRSSEVTLSLTDYGAVTYCSSLNVGNVFACQFHPEKSGANGVRIYQNWFSMNGADKALL